MRLRRLDLIRYGKFTDHAVDFGERNPDEPDLHVIYGANEAGKSTTLQAWLDLLYGIPMQSPYGFRHPYSTMRIGGVIELAGPGGEVQVRSFARVKKAAGSLLDAHDQPVPEDALRGDFGNLSREAYCQMFSLDDETLEKGGEEILTSKGELGQLLFAASAGLSGLSSRLGQAQEEAEALYRKGGSKNRIAELKRQLAELAERRRSLDTIASAYRELVEKAAQAGSALEAAERERRATVTAIAEAAGRSAALPRFRALTEARRQLAELTGLPEASRDAAERQAALRDEAALLDTRRRTLEARIAGLERQIAGVAPDEAILAAASSIEALAGPRSRHETAREDLPKRLAEITALDDRIASHLHSVGRPGEADPDRLLLPAAATARLRDLVSERSGVEALAVTAREELAKARRRLAEAEARLAEAGETDAPTADRLALLDGLAAAVTGLRAGDPAGRLRVAGQMRERAEARLAGRLAELAPWCGGADALAIPGLTGVDGFRSGRAQLETIGVKLAQGIDDQEALRARQQSCEAEIAAIVRIDGLMTDQDAQKLRAAREAAWTAHRQALQPASAERFEQAMREDDRAMAARLAHGADHGRLAELLKARDVTFSDAEAVDRRIDKLRRSESELRSALLRNLPANIAALPLPDIERWLVRHAAALEAREAAREALQEEKQIANEAAAHRGRLASLLESAGLTAAGASTDALFARLDGLIAQENGLKALRRAVAEARRQLEIRTGEADSAENREAEWRAAFTAARAGTWLGEIDASPVEVGAILPVLGELASALETRRDRHHRIAAMRQDQADYAALVASLAETLGMATGGDAIADDARIGERLGRARETSTRRQTLQDNLDADRATGEALGREIADHEARLAAHLQRLQAADLETAQGVVEALARRQALQDEARQAERDILETLRLDDIAAAERLLGEGSAEHWRDEAAGLERKLEMQKEACDTLLLARAGAQRAVDEVGADAEVARIEEERRTIRLEIAEAATRYLRLKAGIVATEQALRLYRERHRSAMLRRASEAFRTISRGAYRELATQPDAKGEKLIASSAGGGSKQASEMSKGTRFQLYLALRVAGYEEFAAARAPMPFIADDIMETFDEMRAEEAFRLFGEMGRLGQVIYLTHHRHLCNIAREVVPSVRIHKIPTDAP